MTWPRPGRAELLLTATAVGWSAVLLAPHWTAVAATTLLYGATFPFCRRLPQLAVLGEIAAELAGWALGVPQESPAGLVALVGALFCLGRFAAGGWLALPVLALPTIALLRDSLGFSSMAFVLLLVLLIWGTGAVVRRRARQAAEARREAAALAAADPVARAGRLVAEERARLAGEVLGVVRAAVEAMLHGARAAARTLEPAACAAVQAEGRRAVGELRRLLGLLRGEQDGPDGPTEQPEHRHAAPWRLDLLITMAALGTVVVEWLGGPGDRSATSLLLSLGLAAGLPVLRTAPAVACLISTVPLVLSILLDARPFQGLETAVVAVALGWAAAADGRRLPLAALGGWALAALVEIRLHEPGNEPMLLALVAIGAVPGHLWRVRHADEVLSRSAAERLRGLHAAVAERAVRAERLRLAREMHDVVSHAVGVMVLQAGAAEMQCGRDPAAAREALDAVRTAGLQAQAELDLLFGLLHAGAVGTAGLADSPPAADLAESVRALVDRMRGGGMRVAVTCDEGLAASPTAYRVVQEALTNAARHAAGSAVTVRLAREGDELVVEVTDDGAGSPTDVPGGGFGLVGLAERVRAEGGRLAAGPRAEGGFGVTARLPLQPAARRTPA